MARRSDHSKEELKSLALAAGEEVLREVGLAGFSTREVAARMGYTVGTLYHVFGNLDGFLLQINGRTLDSWYEDLEICVAEANAAGEHSIHALALGYLRFARVHHHVWLALFEHHLPEGVEIPEWFSPKMQRFFALLERELVAYVPQDIVAVRARLLWSGIHGIVMLALQHKLDVAGEETAEVMCAKMVDALVISC